MSGKSLFLVYGASSFWFLSLAQNIIPFRDFVLSSLAFHLVQVQKSNLANVLRNLSCVFM